MKTDYSAVVNDIECAKGSMGLSKPDERKVEYWLDVKHFKEPMIEKALDVAKNDPQVKDTRHLLNEANTKLLYWSKNNVHTVRELKSFNNHKDIQSAKSSDLSAPQTSPFNQPAKLSYDNAMQAVETEFGKGTDPLKVVMDKMPLSLMYKDKASRFSKKMHCSPESLCKLFMLAHNMNYSDMAIDCASYQYVNELRRKPGQITQPAKYFLGILKHQVSGDATALSEQLHLLKHAKPQWLVKLLDTSPYAEKYDGLVYLRGWQNHMAGWKVQKQPKTLQGRLANDIRIACHEADTGYPSASQLRAAVIVTDTLALADGHKPSNSSQSKFQQAIATAKSQCARHSFDAVLTTNPWQTRLVHYVNIGNVSHDDVQHAQDYVLSRQTVAKKSDCLKDARKIPGYFKAQQAKTNYPLDDDTVEYIAGMVKHDKSVGLPGLDIFNDVQQEVDDYTVKKKYLE